MTEIGFPFGEQELPGLWDEADAAVATCVVAHGANNDMRHGFFTGVAAGLVGEGISALRFDFPYKVRGRAYPDRPPVLLEAWRAAMEEARRRAGDLPVVASGKSMGGRMASMLAAEEGERFDGAALVFFAYPLHAPGRTDSPRVDHLPSVTVPMLFIEGTRDPLARFDLVEDVVRRLGPMARLHVIEGGDHSFRVPGAKRPDREIGEELGRAAAGFIREVTG
jgi:uncharacterized protein